MDSGYITKGDMPLLLPVSRKELPECMPELFERENLFYVNRQKSKLDESIRYMVQYEKSGNKAMYQSHLANKLKAGKDLAALESMML